MHSAIYSMLNKEDCQQNFELTILIEVTLIEIHGQETSELWLSTESNFVHQTKKEPMPSLKADRLSNSKVWTYYDFKTHTQEVFTKNQL
jgi:hypothetical protein